jgi:hypothetical protein
VLLDPTWESTHSIRATSRSKEFPALLRLVLEKGQTDMRKNLSPENQRNPRLQKAGEKATRRALLLDLVDILAGGQLRSWVERSLDLLEQAGKEYEEDDIAQADQDTSASLSIPDDEFLLVVCLFAL